MTIQRSSCCFAVVFLLRSLFPGNESNGCEILCPAVNNAVCKKCEQGNLDESLPVKGGCGMQWVVFCFNLQRVCISIFFMYICFFGGEVGGSTMMVHRD